MNKSDTVDELIGLGFSVDEIAKRAEAAVGFVKGRFTKNGIKWQDREKLPTGVERAIDVPEEVEAVEVVVEKREEVTPSGDSDAETAKEEESDESELSGIEEDLLEALEDYREELKSLPKLRYHRTKKYLDLIDTMLEKGGSSVTSQKAINSRYWMIVPRPKPRGMFSAIHTIHEMAKNHITCLRKK